jgi:hypothetical protein
MRPAQAGPSADLRAFRWNLEPVERRLQATLESARLALARLQQQSNAQEQVGRQRVIEQREQEALALESARRDVFAAAHAVRYLASLETQRIAADARRAELAQRLAAARLACVERQRQFESAQTLRFAAQRQHALEQLRREWRQADAAWLAFTARRRCADPRQARGAT